MRPRGLLLFLASAILSLSVCWLERVEPVPRRASWPGALHALRLEGSLRLRGGGRRRVARAGTKMTLKSLKSMTKKKAERLNLNRAAPELDNTRRRQLNQAKKKSLYGESADSWRIMDPLNVEGVTGGRGETSARERRKRLARKMIETGTSDVSSAEGGDIVDYGDMKRAAEELAAERAAPPLLPNEDDEEDSLPTAAGLLMQQVPGATELGQEGTAKAAMEAARTAALATAPLAAKGALEPPPGALVVPDQCATLHEAVAREPPLALSGTGENWTVFVREGNFSWTASPMSNKERNKLMEDRRRKAVYDWDYEPIDDAAAGRIKYDDLTATYIELHPSLPTRVLHPITSEVVAIPPARPTLDAARYVVVRQRGLVFRGVPAVNASAPSTWLRYPRSRLEGQWVLAERAQAAFEHLLLAHYRPLMSAPAPASSHRCALPWCARSRRRAGLPSCAARRAQRQRRGVHARARR